MAVLVILVIVVSLDILVTVVVGYLATAAHKAQQVLKVCLATLVFQEPVANKVHQSILLALSQPQRVYRQLVT